MESFMRKLVLLLILLPAIAFGQMKITSGKVKNIGYRTYETSSDDWVISLVGLGEVGTNLDLVEKVGYPKYAKAGYVFPFNVIAFQIPAGGYNDYWLIQDWAVQWVKDTYKADKIIVTGYSLGSRGAWTLLKADKAKLITAIAPVAGYYDASQGAIKDLPSVPGYSVHGDRDNTMSYAWDKGGIDEYNRTHPGSQLINGVNQPLHYLQTLPGVSHNSWDFAYDLKGPLLPWITSIFGESTPPPSAPADPVVKTEVINGAVVFTTESGKTVTLKP